MNTKTDQFRCNYFKVRNALENIFSRKNLLRMIYQDTPLSVLLARNEFNELIQDLRDNQL